MAEITKEGVDPSNNNGVSGEPVVEPTLTEEQLADMEVVDKDHYVNQQKRAKKAETALKESKERNAEMEAKIATLQGTKPVAVPPVKETQTSTDFDRVLEFQGKTRDLTSDEISRLTTEAAELGVPTEKYLGTSAWNSSLSLFRNDTAEQQKTLKQTTRVPIYKDKTYKETIANPESSKEDRHEAMRRKLSDAITRNRK